MESLYNEIIDRLLNIKFIVMKKYDTKKNIIKIIINND